MARLPLMIGLNGLVPQVGVDRSGHRECPFLRQNRPRLTQQSWYDFRDNLDKRRMLE